MSCCDHTSEDGKKLGRREMLKASAVAATAVAASAGFATAAKAGDMSAYADPAEGALAEDRRDGRPFV